MSGDVEDECSYTVDAGSAGDWWGDLFGWVTSGTTARTFALGLTAAQAQEVAMDAAAVTAFDLEQHSLDDMDSGDWEAVRAARVKFCGTVVHYFQYNTWLDENDINIDVAADPDSEFAQFGALGDEQSPDEKGRIAEDLQNCHPREDKCLTGEVTPDNSFYHEDADYLPVANDDNSDDHTDFVLTESDTITLVSAGSRLQDQNVCLYGPLVDDTAHGTGWREIHPIDALWWYDPLPPLGAPPRWAYIVFQDDSNRYNDTWAEAPRNIQLEFPFFLAASEAPACARLSRFQAREFSPTDLANSTCEVLGHGVDDCNTASPAAELSDVAPSAVITDDPFTGMLEVTRADGTVLLTVVEDHPAELEVGVSACVRDDYVYGRIRVRVKLGWDGLYYGQIAIGPCESS